MKKLTLAVLAVLLLPALSLATGYNYISQDDMRTQLENKKEMLIVDICPAPQFAKGHLPGSIETNAYPVKSDMERSKLQPTLSLLKASNDPIVIVCPGGKGGAKRTYDFYQKHGISDNRLLILEKGMNGWPYQTSK